MIKPPSDFAPAPGARTTLGTLLARLRRGHLPPLLALAVVHFAVFAPLLVTREDGALIAHIPWDFQDSYHRYLVYVSDCLRSYQLPIWYPYGGGGSPFLVNPQSQMWSPVTWIVSAVVGYTHHVAQRQLVWTTLAGGFGAYLLALDVWREGGRRAALIGGLVYMLTGAVITNFEHLDIVNAAALAPWLFLTLRRAVLDGFRAVPGFAAVIAISITSGYPGVVMMQALWAAAAAVYLMVKLPPAERQRALAALAAGGCLGLLAAAGYWVPVVLHRAAFTRGTPLDLAGSLAQGLRFIDLLGLMFPSLAVLPAPGPTTDVSMRGLYVGVVGLPLAVLCLWRREGRPVGVLLAAAVTALLMSTGAAFFGRVTLNILLPFLRLSRFASADSRALAVLWISLLMAGGAATVATRADEGPGAWRVFLTRAYVVGLVVLPLSLGLLKLTVFPETSGYAFANQVATFTVVQAVFVAAAAVVTRRATSGAGVIRGLAVLLALDLGTGVLACYGTVGQPATAEQQANDIRDHVSTFTPPAPNEPRLVTSPDLGDPAGNVGYTAKRFYLNHYGPFHLITFDQLIARGFQGFLTAGPRVVGLPTVSAAPGYDPANAVLFWHEAQPVDFRFNWYGCSTVDYDVKVPRKIWLVMNESYFPGWSASIDGGSWTPMADVSGGLRAVEVGPGTHHVATRFRPLSFVAGAILTALGWLAIIAWAAVVMRQRRARVPAARAPSHPIP